MGPSPGRPSRARDVALVFLGLCAPSPKFTVRWQSPVSVPTGLKVAATRWQRAQGVIAPAMAWQLFQSQFPGHTVGRGAGPGPGASIRESLAFGGAADRGGDTPSSPGHNERPRVPERRRGPFHRPRRPGSAVARHTPSSELRHPGCPYPRLDPHSPGRGQRAERRAGAQDAQGAGEQARSHGGTDGGGRDWRAPRRAQADGRITGRRDGGPGLGDSQLRAAGRCRQLGRGLRRALRDAPCAFPAPLPG